MKNSVRRIRKTVLNTKKIAFMLNKPNKVEEKKKTKILSKVKRKRSKRARTTLTFLKLKKAKS